VRVNPPPDFPSSSLQSRQRPDGRFAVQFNGTALSFRIFDKIRTVPPGAIVDNKRLSAVLEQVKAQQAALRGASAAGACCPAATAEQPRKHRVCPGRGERHATLPSRRRREAANPIER
jgi:hypothetical protein